MITSATKSGKKSALKRKSERLDAQHQTESEKKKITGKEKVSGIKEGHN